MLSKDSILKPYDALEAVIHIVKHTSLEMGAFIMFRLATGWLMVSCALKIPPSCNIHTIFIPQAVKGTAHLLHQFCFFFLCKMETAG